MFWYTPFKLTITVCLLYTSENTRLGIPLFLAEEAPHGHMAIGTTVFPTGIGMAATWSPVLIEEVGNVIAKEIRSQEMCIRDSRFTLPFSGSLVTD